LKKGEKETKMFKQWSRGEGGETSTEFHRTCKSYAVYQKGPGVGGGGRIENWRRFEEPRN